MLLPYLTPGILLLSSFVLFLSATGAGFTRGRRAGRKGFTALVLVLVVAGWFLPLPALSKGQPKPSRSARRRPGKKTKLGAARKLFVKRCTGCHDTDGKGRVVRDAMPMIPDFTRPAWQKAHTDAQLLAAILNGKGEKMPAFGKRFSKKQARGLVAFIRSFGPKRGQRSRRSPVSTRTRATGKKAARAAGRGLFQKHCAQCHDRDGRGRAVRAGIPAIPDFTRAAWHKAHTDGQLLSAVLDGKGGQMPAFGSRLSRKQARAVVSFVRSLGPRRGKVRAAPGKDDFDTRFRRLQDEFDRLQRELQKLSAPPKQKPASPNTPGRLKP
jgi:mono/diheme cytochrome c family protein